MKKDRSNVPASSIIVAVLILAAGIYVFWRFRLNSSIEPVDLPVIQEVDQAETSIPPGHAKFAVEELNLRFVYPVSQDPIEVNPASTDKNVVTSLKSRDFTINIRDSSELIYRLGGLTCIYDRGLQQFEAEDSKNGVNCPIEKTEIKSQTIFDASHKDGASHNFAYLIPVKFEQYFFEVKISYDSECDSDSSIYSEVCEARAHDTKQKLTDFIDSFIVNNRSLLDCPNC